MGVRLHGIRRLVMVLFGAIGVGLIPWTVWLSSDLRPDHVTHRWDVAWTGFDVGLALAFLATAIAAWRRSASTGFFAGATGTLLVTDAWFDVVLEDSAHDMRVALLEAFLAELPAAAVCFWIAVRTERFLARAVEAVSHLAPAGERAAEGDLVGVLEVAADGEAAREPGHADAPT
ncbi:MAG TPA: hypothetical protein VHC45_08335 [Gaiellaceae bacterium]|jgi:hypothetical protein|nr:hypothetical protein [Gaiellaceae bacterium]